MRLTILFAIFALSCSTEEEERRYVPGNTVCAVNCGPDAGAGDAGPPDAGALDAGPELDAGTVATCATAPKCEGALTCCADSICRESCED